MASLTCATTLPKPGPTNIVFFLIIDRALPPPFPQRTPIPFPLPRPITSRHPPSIGGGGSSVFADLGASDSTNRTIHHCCEHFPLCKQECVRPTHNIKAIDESLLCWLYIVFFRLQNSLWQQFLGINQRINRCDPKCRPTQPVPMHKYHLPSSA